MRMGLRCMTEFGKLFIRGFCSEAIRNARFTKKFLHFNTIHAELQAYVTKNHQFYQNCHKTWAWFLHLGTFLPPYFLSLLRSLVSVMESTSSYKQYGIVNIKFPMP